MKRMLRMSSRVIRRQRHAHGRRTLRKEGSRNGRQNRLLVFLRNARRNHWNRACHRTDWTSSGLGRRCNARRTHDGSS